jgi:small subunit ribosomal protein S1
MTTNRHDDQSERIFRPAEQLDPGLQKELDDALGDLSIEELMDAEPGEAARPAEDAPAAEGVRRGTVIAVQGDDVFVDFGGPTQGVLPAEQFRDEPLPAVGDAIEVVVDDYDAGEGLLILSRQGAVRAAAWETLEVGQIVEARVTATNKGGLELDLSGIRAFMPASQVELFRADDLGAYVNQRLRCEVSEIDRRGENVVLSRRALLEREAEAARREAWERLEEGQVIEGLVRSIMPYGAFVDIGGVDGLLHVSDMAYSRVADPHDVVQEGQKVRVKVLKLDRDERRVSLGLKQTMADPWDGAEARWPPDSTATGQVTRLADFGAFVELADGVEGLIPISELAHGRRIRHPREVLDAGDAVRVQVLNVDPERRRIGLSLKRLQDDPWTGASVRWPKDTLAQGVVTRVEDFGAFVEMTEGVEGLVHVSELSDRHVQRVADAVTEGQSVQVKVLSVDEGAHRMSLSIKQARRSAAPPPPAADDPARPRRKRKRPLKGGLD